MSTTKPQCFAPHTRNLRISTENSYPASEIRNEAIVKSTRNNRCVIQRGSERNSKSEGPLTGHGGRRRSPGPLMFQAQGTVIGLSKYRFLARAWPFCVHAHSEERAGTLFTHSTGDLGMKAFVMRRASFLAVPVMASIGWSGAAFAEDAPAAPAPAAAAPVAPAPPAAPPAPKWYDEVKNVDGFVDAYASVNFNFPKPQRGSMGFARSTSPMARRCTGPGSTRASPPSRSVPPSPFALGRARYLQCPGQCCER